MLLREDDETVQVLTIAETVIHVTRRQSVRRGLYVIQQLKDMPQGEREGQGALRGIEEDNAENDETSQSDYRISESEIDSSQLTDYENDYDDRDHISFNSYHLHNNNNDVVVVEEVMEMREGDEEVVKNDDVDSIDFLFSND
eukprot:gene17108-19586_t